MTRPQRLFNRELFFITILVTGVLVSNLFANETHLLKISEKQLIQKALKSASTLLMLEEQNLQTQWNHSMFEEKFSPTLFAKGQVTKTKEKSLIAVRPVMSPVEDYSVGILQNLKSGISLDAHVFSNKMSTTNGLLTDGVTLGAMLSLSIDLHKDFLGGLTHLEESRIILSKKATEIETAVQSRVLLISVRKIYWALVANDLALDLSKKLLQSSVENLQDQKKRLQNKITDRGVVAKYSSQVAQRRASISVLENERQNLFKELKILVPSIASNTLVLDSYDINKSQEQVMGCIQKISSYQKIPYEYSPYDELVKIFENAYQNEMKIHQNHAKWDLKMKASVKAQHADFGYSETLSTALDEARQGHSLGVEFSLPLGNQKKTTQELSEQISKLKWLRLKGQTSGKMETFHLQIIKSIHLLNEVMKQQQENASHLKISLNVMEEKFRQARASVGDLIQDQDLYLQSKLSEIQIQLQTVVTLLDYFSVFVDVPCAFNEMTMEKDKVATNVEFKL